MFRKRNKEWCHAPRVEEQGAITTFKPEEGGILMRTKRRKPQFQERAPGRSCDLQKNKVLSHGDPEG